MEERECNTCKYYDPEEGICARTAEYHHGYEGEDCENWVDWEDAW